MRLKCGPCPRPLPVVRCKSFASSSPAETSRRAPQPKRVSCANSNATHNVYLALDAEKVREEADTLPRRFPPVAKPPLYGVPVSIKDCFDVAGFPTTLGSRFYAARNGVAGEDSAVASRLRSQGAIIIGKTHMHPLAYGITGENPDYGDCVQPTDRAATNRRVLRAAPRPACRSSRRWWRSARTRAGRCACRQRCVDSPDTARRWSWRSGADCGAAEFTWHPRSTPWDGCFRICATRRCWLRRCLTCACRRRPTSFRIGCVSDGFLDDCDSQVLADFADWKKKLTATGATIIPADTSYWEEAPEIYAANHRA